MDPTLRPDVVDICGRKRVLIQARAVSGIWQVLVVEPRFNIRACTWVGGSSGETRQTPIIIAISLCLQQQLAGMASEEGTLWYLDGSRV